MQEIKFSDVKFYPRGSCKHCVGTGYQKVYVPNSFRVDKESVEKANGKMKTVRTFVTAKEPTISPCKCLSNKVRKQFIKDPEEKLGYAPLVIEGIESVVVVPADLLKEDEAEVVEAEVVEEDNKG